MTSETSHSAALTQVVESPEDVENPHNNRCTGRISRMLEKISVLQKDREYFEKEWHHMVFEKVSSIEGFLFRSTNAVLERSDRIYYVSLYGFDSASSLKEWLTSHDRLTVMQEGQNRGLLIESLTLNGSTDSLLMDQPVGDILAVTVSDMNIERTGRRPPPKWKLFIIVWIGVCGVVNLSAFAGIFLRMLKIGFPLYIACLFDIFQTQVFLNYGFFPLVYSNSLVNQWLSQPRPPAEFMNDFWYFFDQGLDMFAIDESLNVKEMLQRITVLESRIETLRQLQSQTSAKVNSLEELKNNDGNLGFIPSAYSDSAVVETWQQNLPTFIIKSNPPPFRADKSQGKLMERTQSIFRAISKRSLHTSSYWGSHKDTSISNQDISTDLGRNTSVTLSVRNKVKWQYIDKYMSWLRDMIIEMNR